MANKIAVLMGGHSIEREISLMSGNAIIDGLLKLGLNAYALDIQNFSLLSLKKNSFQKVFLALHGSEGENGQLQAALDYIGIPHTGNSILSSALAIDKIRTKLVWQGNKLPTNKFTWLTRKNFKINLNKYLLKIIDFIGLPLFIKPNSLGSSIGISKVYHCEDIVTALEKAFYYDDIAIIESCSSGPEYTVGIIGNTILPVVKIQPSKEFYNYEAKYFSKDTQYFCPSGLSQEQEQKLQNLAYYAWQILGGNKWGRVDVMFDKFNKFQLLEVNTSPGMTKNSLIPLAAQVLGWDYSELILRILNI